MQRSAKQHFRKRVESKMTLVAIDASTGQDQLDQSHLRDIDIHENRDERLAGF